MKQHSATKRQNATTKRIQSVTINRMDDTDPDTSLMGEYASTPTSEFSIDRGHSLDCPINTGVLESQCTCDEGNLGRDEYEYFNPSFNYVDKAGHALPENTPAEVRKYVLQDYERMEDLNRGGWCFLGIKAVADIAISAEGGGQTGNRTYLGQTISSGGLWGIESDSSASDIAEIEQEQRSELRQQLQALGFTKRSISAAFRNIERKEN